ncbi:phosphopantetheine-binding protein [Lysinibacillus capsici]|uniref:phosphopantetheine-binding protein n=1 Tax=Lysinibacillus TaxID=400634 RepID=UPI0009F1A3C3|nr:MULTISPECIES: phosphopantetheine-binding protein [Lysinibacillus]AUS84880.1 phosphopantetheine-binding protein [Lysinibacillus sp. YS11]MEC1304546.1 phosphopantetheine-binding protein [Lysinibacillus capsici]MED3876113.1 phosphopantetheine-binding protein [Lysinibacillus capsici]WPK05536.1 phosphopantetheine-binding protein [Lysinibacillus capsici]
MLKKNTFEITVATLREVLDIDTATEILPETSLESLSLDSTSIFELLMVLEDNIDGFSVDPEDIEPEYFESVETIVDYINNSLVSA